MCCCGHEDLQKRRAVVAIPAQYFATEGHTAECEVPIAYPGPRRQTSSITPQNSGTTPEHQPHNDPITVSIPNRFCPSDDPPPVALFLFFCRAAFCAACRMRTVTLILHYQSQVAHDGTPARIASIRALSYGTLRCSRQVPMECCGTLISSDMEWHL